MAEARFLRFAGRLDPKAQEFRPSLTSIATPITILEPSLPPMTAEPHVLPYTVHPVPLSPHYQVQHIPAPLVQCIAASPVLPPQTKAPTRTIVLSSVPNDVEEAVVRMEMEAFGEVRAVQMERAREGIVTVHFYDIRNSDSALHSIRAQHMRHQSRMRDYLACASLYGCVMIQPPSPLQHSAREPGMIGGRAVWAQFIIPCCNSLPDGNNQGTIVLFNLDPDVSSSYLEQVFQVFGEVKDIRETPFKRQQRFIEFYDVRDAAKALAVMDGKNLFGRRMIIEFSRPGGYGKMYPPLSGEKICLSGTSCNLSVNPASQPLKTNLFENGHRRGQRSKKSDGISPIHPFSLSRCPIEEPSFFGRKTSERPRRSSNACNSTSIVQQPEEPPAKGRVGGGGFGRPSRKSKNSRKADIRFLISEDSTVYDTCKDSRTTVMIKNIPNKYSQQLLVDMLDNHCMKCNENITNGDDEPFSAYDFVYLPIDFNNKCNVGYGFVNMTTPQATIRLYKAFHLREWEAFNSRKICEVAYARVQGLDALKEHFKNSKFPCEMVHYLPATFTPPRDGMVQPDPLPLVDLTNEEEDDEIGSRSGGGRSDDTGSTQTVERSLLNS